MASPLISVRPNRVAAVLPGLLYGAVLLWLGVELGADRPRPVLLVTGGLLLGAVFLTRRYRQWVLAAAFGGLALGWRGLEILPGLRVFPSELFIWLAFVLLLAPAARAGDAAVSRRSFPLPGVGLAIAALLAVATGLINHHDARLVAGEAKTFLVFVPALVLMHRWVQSSDDVRFQTRVIVAAGVLVGALGLLERLAPQVSSIAPWLFTHPIDIRENFGTGGEILLSGFSSWGGPIVAVILVPLVGLVGVTARRAAGRPDWVAAAMRLILVAAIIASGYRSSWLGLVVSVGVLALLDRRSWTALLFGGGAILYFLPSAFLDRFRTILLLERSGDTSIIWRLEALHDGMRSIGNHPLQGTGWGSQIVFNDWVYLAVVLGLPAALLLAWWYGHLLLRLWRLAVRPATAAGAADRRLALGFLVGLSGYAACMVSGAMTQVPPLMTSFWLLFCLALRFTEIAAKSAAAIPIALNAPPRKAALASRF